MDKNYYQYSKLEILKALDTSERGLSNTEAKKRLYKNGKNVLKSGKKRGFFYSFFKQFCDVLILILLASAIISIVVAIIEHDPSEYVDAGIILFVILINAIIGTIQESSANNAMERLKTITTPKTKVLRNSRIVKIKTEDVVVGDIVILEAGDSIPADLRILESASLKIEESALTGESLAVEKHDSLITEEVAIGDRINMAYMGTTVAHGRGKGVVVATAMDTEIGKIANLLRNTKNEATPLTKKIKKTSIYISIIVLIVCLFILFLGIANGDSFGNSLILAVVIAVCAVPEGLPACMTITMSMSVNEMAKKRAIVKNLTAVETLGSTDIICSDKTGTLTLNKMVVKEVFLFDKNHIDEIQKLSSNDTDKVEKIVSESRNFNQLIKCMLLCNDSQLKFEEGYLYSIGDPTEIALSEYGYTRGIIKEKVDGKYERIDEIPFESERKLMTTFNRDGNNIISYTKGAVDNLIERCDRVMIDGKIVKMTKKLKEEIILKNSDMCNRALRVLGFAQKTYTDKLQRKMEVAEENMVFLGLIGMMDPPRTEVFDAIKTCKKAGITTIMITGDHRDTAFAIAKELEIASSENEVITGAEIDKLSEEDFLNSVEKFRVYARVSPEHKVKIVEALKKKGKIVAMTGDGVNDAPSIRRADIGVGMGITGTDVTKEAADIILTDDNFATIVGAVKEGRRVYSNISKVVQYLLGTSLAELIILTVVLSILRYSFFTPALILWFNLVSDTLVAIAIGREKEELDIMNQKPRKKENTLFSGRAGVNMIFSCIVVSIMTLGTFFFSKHYLNVDPIVSTSMCYVVICIAELFHVYNLKSDIHSVFNKRILDNKWLNISFVISMILSLIIVLVPSNAIRGFFGVTGLDWKQWLICLGVSILIIPLTEIWKAILRRIEKKKK